MLTMDFHAEKSKIKPNGLYDRFWMGIDTAFRYIQQNSAVDLQSASQTVLLSRKSAGIAPAMAIAGVSNVDSFAEQRPRLIKHEDVMSSFQEWVVQRMGWAPTQKSIERVHAAVASAARACKADVMSADEFISLAGLVEALESSGRAGSLRKIATAENDGCLCAVLGEMLGERKVCVKYDARVCGRSPCRDGPPAIDADILLLHRVLEYVDDPMTTMHAAFRAMKPGALLFATARGIASRHLYNDGRVLLRTLTSSALVVTSMRAGFDVIASQHWGTRDFIKTLVTADEPRDYSYTSIFKDATAPVPASEWVYSTLSWVMLNRPEKGKRE
jgi:hypothetical protein